MLRVRRFGFEVIVLMSKRHEHVKEQIVFICLSAVLVKPYLHVVTTVRFALSFFFTIETSCILQDRSM